MKILFTILTLGSALLIYPQESKVYFNDALSQHLKSYNVKSDKAISANDKEREEFLFDSLINNHLKGTLIPNLVLHCIDGDIIETDSLKTPFLLITKASWHIQNDNEITEINKMAEQYENQLEIILLFWDKKNTVKRLIKDYSQNVKITYIDESKNRSNQIIKTYKHSFGVPACFFISNSKQLVSIDRKFRLTNNTKYHSKYSNINTYKNIALLLFNDIISPLDVITIID